MQAAVIQAGLFVGGMVGASAMLALGVRMVRGRNGDDGEYMSVADAARFAHQRATLEDLPMARVAEQRSPGGCVAWFEKSLRQVVLRSSKDPDAKVSKSQLARYLDWLRSVQ